MIHRAVAMVGFPQPFLLVNSFIDGLVDKRPDSCYRLLCSRTFPSFPRVRTPPAPLPTSSALSAHSRALFCTRAKRIPFPFNHPRTLCAKHPGVTKRDYSFRRLTPQSPLTPVESALADEFRVGFQGLYLQTLSQQTTEVGRTSPSATLLESALTATCFVTPLESALTKKLGEGESMLASPPSLGTPTLRRPAGLAGRISRLAGRYPSAATRRPSRRASVALDSLQEPTHV